jgi:glucan phosphorylase
LKLKKKKNEKDDDFFLNDNHVMLVILDMRKILVDKETVKMTVGVSVVGGRLSMVGTWYEYLHRNDGA